jgi:hypothetical protein
MSNEAEELYFKLVREHGMPESPTLSKLGTVWYLMPENVNADPGEAVSTAVFRPLQPDQAAAAMALHASEWALTFVKPADEAAPRSSNPVTRLQQVIHESTRRK